MNNVQRCAESLELDEEFVYISEQGCERNEPTLNYNIEPLRPILDVEYLFQSRYRQLKGFIRQRVHNDQDAEDIAQSAYLEALKKSDNYKGLSRPDVWLFGIALNLIRNHSKKEKNRARVWEENFGHTMDDEYIEVEQSPYQLVSDNEILGRINKAVERLPADMAQVFNAVVLENKTYQEVAEVFGIPTGTVRSRLSRARDKLKDFAS